MNNIDFPIYDMKVYSTSEDALRALKDLYSLEMRNLESISKEPLSAMALESIVYPMLAIFTNDSVYYDQFTKFDELDHYYSAELRYLCNEVFLNHNISFGVGKSNIQIPISLVNEDVAAKLTQEQKMFRRINIFSVDEISNIYNNNRKRILWFNPIRVDYAFNKIKHYCGISGDKIQNHVLYVNYQKYLPYFVQYAIDEISAGRAIDLVGPDSSSLVANSMKMPASWTNAVSLPQMPAYSLLKENNDGITLINIGVGASNVKTISDYIAVLRPKLVLLLGHCAGLADRFSIGDYIVGTDHIFLNFYNEPDFKVRSSGSLLVEKCNLDFTVNYGPVVSVCDRNWEFNACGLLRSIEEYGPVAVDMESAVMIKVFNETNIPAISFLCISDRPMHKEVRLRKMAQIFYENHTKRQLYDACSMIHKIITFKTIKTRSIESVLFR